MTQSSPNHFHQTAPTSRLSALAELSWFFGPSSAMQQLEKKVRGLEGEKGSVLLQGEQGVGKSLVARLLHELSHANGHFVTFDAAAVAPSCLEAELAQAMQNTARDGQWGTLHLLGAHTLPLVLQKRLLQHYQSCGETGSVLPSPRLICSTTENVGELVEKKLFSLQLYKIIQTHTLHIPSLAQRSEDIAPAAEYFSQQYGGNAQRKLSREAIKVLSQQPWQGGNLRMLASCVQRAVAASERHILGAEDFKPYLPAGQAGLSGPGCDTHICLPQAAENCLSRYFDNLRGMAPAPDLYERIMGEVEKPLLEHVLRYVRGNQLRAAEVLGINRNTLRKKIRQWEIDAKNVDGR